MLIFIYAVRQSIVNLSLGPVAFCKKTTNHRARARNIRRHERIIFRQFFKWNLISIFEFIFFSTVHYDNSWWLILYLSRKKVYHFNSSCRMNKIYELFFLSSRLSQSMMMTMMTTARKSWKMRVESSTLLSRLSHWKVCVDFPRSYRNQHQSPVSVETLNDSIVEIYTRWFKKVFQIKSLRKIYILFGRRKRCKKNKKKIRIYMLILSVVST